MAKNKNKPEIDKVCAYCELALPLQDRDFMLCSKRGVVSAGHHCRYFSYDPLKRVPMPRKNISADLTLPELP